MLIAEAPYHAAADFETSWKASSGGLLKVSHQQHLKFKVCGHEQLFTG
jgi:hypothetical protein